MVLLLFGTAILLAAGSPPALKDPFLDNFVGDWSVARKMGNGRTFAIDDATASARIERPPTPPPRI